MSMLILNRLYIKYINIFYVKCLFIYFIFLLVLFINYIIECKDFSTKNQLKKIVFEYYKVGYYLYVMKL